VFRGDLNRTCGNSQDVVRSARIGLRGNCSETPQFESRPRLSGLLESNIPAPAIIPVILRKSRRPSNCFPTNCRQHSRFIPISLFRAQRVWTELPAIHDMFGYFDSSNWLRTLPFVCPDKADHQTDSSNPKEVMILSSMSGYVIGIDD